MYWVLALLKYDFEIIHRKSVLHHVSDAETYVEAVATIQKTTDALTKRRVTNIEKNPRQFPDWKVEQGRLITIWQTANTRSWLLEIGITAKTTSIDVDWKSRSTYFQANRHQNDLCETSAAVLLAGSKSERIQQWTVDQARSTNLG